MICPRCGRALRDGAKFCTACGHPLTASEASPAMAMRPPRFLAGIDNMLASGAWNEEFKDWLAVLRPRLIDAWGLDFVFDNGLCAPERAAAQGGQGALHRIHPLLRRGGQRPQACSPGIHPLAPHRAWLAARARPFE